jgi:orotidine-5'-phosphate decarboxylase
MLTEKIIVALDLEVFTEAAAIVRQLPQTSFFKVGLQAFLKYGEEILGMLQANRKKTFLDLKFLDIPNTVYNAVRSCAKWHPHFLTVHLSGGEQMLRKASDAAAESGSTILGVTVLTSFSQAELNGVGIGATLPDQVLRLAELGLRCGITHFVCSPQEIELLKSRFQNDIRLVTPGVRPSWSSKDDQERVLSPREALLLGADFLVIGRPLIKHQTVLQAWEMLLEEIS